MHPLRKRLLQCRPFTNAWWSWMIATGVFLALTLSCKMVGLFLFLTVGSAVLYDLWNIIDIRRGNSMVRIRSVCLAPMSC